MDERTIKERDSFRCRKTGQQALNEIKKQIVIIKSAKNDFNTLSVKLNQ